MVRRFLLIMFDSFILVVIFIQLFQFSGSQLYLGGYEKVFNNNSYFGFQSLIDFVTDLGDDSKILDAWKDAIDWFLLFMNWVVDNISDRWKQVISLSSTNVFFDVLNAFAITFYILVAPVVLGIGLGGFIVFFFRLVWQFVTLIFALFSGKYNTPLTFNSESISEVVRLCVML